MSTLILPLLVLWAMTRNSSSPQAGPFLFQWPTTASPPPPMSAFTAQPTANTGTPLAELAQPSPQHKPPPVAKKGAAPKTIVTAKRKTPAQAALHAARSRVPSASSMLSFGSPIMQSNVSVLEIQHALNQHNAKLKPDGLYGPKTAGAWQTIAKSKGLAASISRVGPKVAKVVTKTYDALKVPPIP